MVTTGTVLRVLYSYLLGIQNWLIFFQTATDDCLDCPMVFLSDIACACLCSVNSSKPIVRTREAQTNKDSRGSSLHIVGSACSPSRTTRFPETDAIYLREPASQARSIGVDHEKQPKPANKGGSITAESLATNVLLQVLHQMSFLLPLLVLCGVDQDFDSPAPKPSSSECCPAFFTAFQAPGDGSVEDEALGGG